MAPIMGPQEETGMKFAGHGTEKSDCIRLEKEKISNSVDPPRKDLGSYL